MAGLLDYIPWRTLCRILVVLYHVGVASSVYVDSVCQYNSQSLSINCQEGEVIRIRSTHLSQYRSMPGMPIICEPSSTNPYCNAPTNSSDKEFVGRQSASYVIPAEILYNKPDKKGECLPGVRSDIAEVSYECVPTSGSFLQSICSDIFWENEVRGYLSSPGFPNNFPEGERTCQCELRPAEGSQVELVAILMNPSTSGVTWTLRAESENGNTQELSSQSYVSTRVPLQSGSGKVKLIFRSQGSGGQRPALSGPPGGFWLQYKAIKTSSAPPVYPTSNTGGFSNNYPNQGNNQNSRNNYPNSGSNYPNSGSNYPNYGNAQYMQHRAEGRVTLFCNDPDLGDSASAGVIAGVVITVVLLLIIIAVGVFFYLRKRKKDKGQSYVTSGSTPPPPHVYSGKTAHTNHAMEPSTPTEKRAPEKFDEHPHYVPYSHRERDVHYEKEGIQGRASRGRAHSNTSSMDKVFIEDIDHKSAPSSTKTGDTDSIAKKSLSQDSQADAYSDVNYNPNYPAIRFSATSLGRDTAV